MVKVTSTIVWSIYMLHFNIYHFSSLCKYLTLFLTYKFVYVIQERYRYIDLRTTHTAFSFQLYVHTQNKVPKYNISPTLMSHTRVAPRSRCSLLSYIDQFLARRSSGLKWKEAHILFVWKSTLYEDDHVRGVHRHHIFGQVDDMTRHWRPTFNLTLK